MEAKRNSSGELVIRVDEDTIVRFPKEGGAVLRQEMGGDVERVYLTVEELRGIVTLMDIEEA